MHGPCVCNLGIKNARRKIGELKKKCIHCVFAVAASVQRQKKVEVNKKILKCIHCVFAVPASVQRRPEGGGGVAKGPVRHAGQERGAGEQPVPGDSLQAGPLLRPGRGATRHQSAGE